MSQIIYFLAILSEYIFMHRIMR